MLNSQLLEKLYEEYSMERKQGFIVEPGLHWRCPVLGQAWPSSKSQTSPAVKLVPALTQTGELGCPPPSRGQPSSADAVGSLHDHPSGPCF